MIDDDIKDAFKTDEQGSETEDDDSVETEDGDVVTDEWEYRNMECRIVEEKIGDGLAGKERAEVKVGDEWRVAVSHLMLQFVSSKREHVEMKVDSMIDTAFGSDSPYTHDSSVGTTVTNGSDHTQWTKNETVRYETSDLPEYEHGSTKITNVSYAYQP